MYIQFVVHVLARSLVVEKCTSTTILQAQRSVCGIQRWSNSLQEEQMARTRTTSTGVQSSRSKGRGKPMSKADQIMMIEACAFSGLQCDNAMDLCRKRKQSKLLGVQDKKQNLAMKLFTNKCLHGNGFSLATCHQMCSLPIPTTCLATGHRMCSLPIPMTFSQKATRNYCELSSLQVELIWMSIRTWNLHWHMPC